MFCEYDHRNVIQASLKVKTADGYIDILLRLFYACTVSWPWSSDDQVKSMDPPPAVSTLLLQLCPPLLHQRRQTRRPLHLQQLTLNLCQSLDLLHLWARFPLLQEKTQWYPQRSHLLLLPQTIPNFQSLKLVTVWMLLYSLMPQFKRSLRRPLQ